MKKLIIILILSCLATAGGSRSGWADSSKVIPPDLILRIVFIGDSLTAGYGIPKEQSFPQLIETELNRELQKSGSEVRLELINAGISGSTTASAPQRLKWQLRSKVKADIVVLALGGNDGLRGIKVDASKENLRQAIKIAKDEGIKVLLAGMQIPPNYGPEYTKAFAGMFPELATSEGIPLIPFLLEGVGGEPQFNLPDGIHPNEKGHEIIAQTVLKFLRPLIKEVEPKA